MACTFSFVGGFGIQWCQNIIVGQRLSGAGFWTGYIGCSQKLVHILDLGQKTKYF